MNLEQLMQIKAPNATYDYALPQEWVTDFENVTKFNPAGNFVWMYDGKLFGRPYWATLGGREALLLYNELKDFEYCVDATNVVVLRRWEVMPRIHLCFGEFWDRYATWIQDPECPDDKDRYEFIVEYGLSIADAENGFEKRQEMLYTVKSHGKTRYL